jgi:hypothetical protein
LGIAISKDETEGIINCQPYAIENFLKKVYFKVLIKNYKNHK